MGQDYIVDFGSLILGAESKEEARKEAEQMLKDGYVPCIDTVLLND